MSFAGFFLNFITYYIIAVVVVVDVLKKTSFYAGQKSSNK